MNEKIRIRLKAYDHRVLDQSVGEIVETVRSLPSDTGKSFSLPVRIDARKKGPEAPQRSARLEPTRPSRAGIGSRGEEERRLLRAKGRCR